jgi:ABC-2 type transport system permease protein
LLLFSAAAAAVGLLVSALAESQAVAFFITAFVLLLFWIPGQLPEHLGGNWVGDSLLWISFSSRLEGFMKGLIDTRDVLFFLSVAALALVISFRALERRKWS